jgi:hypothetical protein
MQTPRFAALRRHTLRAVLVAAASAAAVRAQQGGGDEPQAARDLLDKYVETRRIISQEKRDAALGREMLAEQIDLAKRQIEELRAKTAEVSREIATADEKKAALVAENAMLIEVADALATTLAALESRTKELVARLPDPIRAKVGMVSQQIPDKPGETKVSLGQRFLNVIALLNEVNRFNREITITSEVRTLANGREAEVTAIYVGLGQAYYVSARRDAAGIGTPSPQGWVWTPAAAAAESIARLVAILENKQPAGFVRVPVRIE